MGIVLSVTYEATAEGCCTLASYQIQGVEIQAYTSQNRSGTAVSFLLVAYDIQDQKSYIKLKSQPLNGKAVTESILFDYKAVSQTCWSRDEVYKVRV